MRTLKQLFRFIPAAACSLLITGTLSAATLSGTITNRTTNKPSKGDTVALINTAQGMDEIAKAVSDNQGKFQLNAPDGGQILLHITHEGADYFKSVSAGEANVAIDVYDSAAKVDDITGEAMVFRAQTDASGKTLGVSENFFVRNASAPARTQFGGNTLDFFLPKGAQISQTVASAPNGLPTNVEYKTIDAVSGHYAFTFPLRPGETRFQVNYTMPYTGKQSFSLKLGLPTGDIAVMLPKTMQFEAGAQTPFQAITPDVNALTYDAHNPSAALPVEFAIAGQGQLPQQTATSGSEQENQSAAAQSGQTSSERPGGGMAPPGDPEGDNDPWAKYKWWIVGLLGLALAGGAGVMLRKSAAEGQVPLSANSAPALGSSEAAGDRGIEPARVAGARLQTLKDELFELETDRLAGRITQSEYEEHKAAFDVLLRRALSRIEPGTETSNV